jgi:ubiquinone/menaquinone biosynthesis C-methylase UbiE
MRPKIFGLSPGQLLSKRFRLSDKFACILDAQGHVIIYEFSRPEIAFVAPDQTRVLLSCFPSQQATSVKNALETFMRHFRTKPSQKVLDTLFLTIAGLVRLGVLVNERASENNYTRQMAPYYVRTRSIPQELSATIVQACGVNRESRILDIGTGTGSLALQLAEVSEHVTGIDVCKPFLTIAKNSARSKKLKAAFCFESANKLVFSSKRYDIVVASQVFHWLDPMMATRGLYHVLPVGGQFFAIESKAVLADSHPLNKILGYGREKNLSMITSSTSHINRYAALFTVLRQGTSLLNLNAIWIFRQYRPFNIDFTRAYFFTQQLRRAMPEEKDPWARLEQMMNAMSARQLHGHMYWVLAQFKNIGPADQTATADVTPHPIINIPYVRQGKDRQD